MRISELKRLGRGGYSGGRAYLAKTEPQDLKPLPGGSRYEYTVRHVANTLKSGIEIRIWDPEGPLAGAGPAPKAPDFNLFPEYRDYHAAMMAKWQINKDEEERSGRKSPQLIGKLVLEEVSNFPLSNAYRVEAITVDEDFRGKGIGKSLYGIALSILKITLLAGEAQTPGGRKNWAGLSKIPGVQLKGYAMIFRNGTDFEQRATNAVMNDMDGVFLGNSPDGKAKFLTFDVKPNTTGDEIETTIKNKMIKIYNPGGALLTGLYAQWQGQ